MAELRLPGILQCALALHRGMAGARRSFFARAGPRGVAELFGQRPQRAAAVAYRGGRRVALALGALAFLGAAHAQVLSSRIWPATDYTRLTLESKSELKYSVFSVKDPERLVVDLEAAGDLAPALAELNGKVTAEDPYIQGLRVARNRPGVVR